MFESAHLMAVWVLQQGGLSDLFSNIPDHAICIHVVFFANELNLELELRRKIWVQSIKKKIGL